MDRRRILLIIAAVVAALGVALVFIYVRSADNRAADNYATVDVLGVAQQIEPGTSIDQASANGQLTVLKVQRNQVLSGAVVAASDLAGQVALVTLYPGEQVISSKFGAQAAVQQDDPLDSSLPEGFVSVTVSLTDTQRSAGFINAGSHVAVYYTGANAKGVNSTQVLLPNVTVIAVGSTTSVPTTTTSTDASGAATGTATTEVLPRTLLTVAVEPADAKKMIFARGSGELSFSLFAGKTSPVKPGDPTSLANLTTGN